MKKITNYKGLIRLGTFFIIFVIIAVVFAEAFTLLSGVSLTSGNYSLKEELGINSIVLLLPIVITIYICSVLIFKEKVIPTIGLQIKNRLKDIFAGLILGCAMIVLGFVILLIINQVSIVSFSFNYEKLLYITAIFITVALLEELLFRGILLKNLIISFNKYVSLIISSAIFALAHGGNPHFSFLAWLNIFLSSIILSMTVIYTKNIWFSISFHFSWNLVQSLLGFNVSGNEGYSIVNLQTGNNDIISGAEFGFEGSIICSIISIIPILYFFLKRKKFIKPSSLNG